MPTKTNKFKCVDCSALLGSKSGLNAHRKYNCKMLPIDTTECICGKHVGTHYLRRHQKYYCAALPIVVKKCICGKILRHQSYARHVKYYCPIRKQKQVFNCTYCHESHDSERALMVHTKICCEARNNAMYKCKCGKIYATDRKRKLHRKRSCHLRTDFIVQ